MLITHMQATSISHMCSLHTCVLLQCCIHADYTHASYKYFSHVRLVCMCIIMYSTGNMCSWVANLVLSSFILSSYGVSFGQLGRDSLRDKEIEMNSWGIQKNWYPPQVYCTQAHEVCSLHACILCAVVHMPHT